MSTTTEDRQESTGESKIPKGFVTEALRRPIEEAVKEGVKEAMQEQAEVTTTSDERSQDAGGSGRWKFALLALIGLGAAFYLLRRRRNGGSDRGGGIRDESKTVSDTSMSESAGGSVESAGQGVGDEEEEEETEAQGATPGASDEGS